MTEPQNKTPLAAHDLAEGAAKGADKKTPLGCIFVFDSNALQLGHGWPNTCGGSSAQSKATARAASGHGKRSAGTGAARAGASSAARASLGSPLGNHGETSGIVVMVGL